MAEIRHEDRSSGGIDFQDLLALLFAWGPCADCPEDIDGNGEVDFQDLLALLFAWGACPSGACCFPDGTCAARIEAHCVAADGTYNGDGSQCSSVSCPQPGACCLPDGSCEQAEFLGGLDCTGQGGVYQVGKDS